MKFKDYLKDINQLAKDNPECLEFDVVYGEDDAGNRFDNVYFSPCLGVFNEVDNLFIDDKDDYEEEYGENFTPNAVCVN